MFSWFRQKTDVKTLEKELAALTSRIHTHEASLSQLRASGRRYKGAVTLYCALFYFVYFVIWILLFARNMDDRRKWVKETVPVIFGPFVIYFLRRTVSGYYSSCTSSAESTLESLRVQQKEKVEEFKTKTDFYTTKSLIDRYSGTDSPSEKTPIKASGTSSSGKKVQEVPPAQIRAPQIQVRQSPRLATQSQLTPQRGPPQSLIGTVPTPSSLSGTPTRTSRDPSLIPEFAPNAEAPAPHAERHWYDRMLDVIVGEDEGGESSRYNLEQKVRERERRIAGLELELMKLRKMVSHEAIIDSPTSTPGASPDAESPHESVTDSSPVGELVGGGSQGTTATQKEETTKTRKSKRNKDADSGVRDDD